MVCLGQSSGFLEFLLNTKLNAKVQSVTLTLGQQQQHPDMSTSVHEPNSIPSHISKGSIKRYWKCKKNIYLMQLLSNNRTMEGKTEPIYPLTS